jgi:hypothetical protein
MNETITLATWDEIEALPVGARLVVRVPLARRWKPMFVVGEAPTMSPCSCGRVVSVRVWQRPNEFTSQICACRMASEGRDRVEVAIWEQVENPVHVLSATRFGALSGDGGTHTASMCGEMVPDSDRDRHSYYGLTASVTCPGCRMAHEPKEVGA